MGQMEDLRLFVQVVEAGSISKAADRLGIAKSAVSRRLGLLEDRYSTRLIDRDPGTWAVTRTGHELLQRATRLVHDMDEIDGDFASTASVTEGPLSVSMPREFGISFLGPAIIAFKARYPQIRLTVEFDDRQVDLDRENHDLAIRISRPRDDREEAMRIGTVRHALHACQDYLARHPPITDIGDLHGHRLLNFGPARRTYWEFLSSFGKLKRVEFAPHLNSNSGQFLLNAVKAGLGIARLPDFIARDMTPADNVVRVLPEIRIPERGIYLVHAAQRRLDRRTRLFAEAMKQACLPGQPPQQAAGRR